MRNYVITTGQLLIVVGLILWIDFGGIALGIVILGIIEYFYGESVEWKRQSKMQPGQKSQPSRGPKPSTMVAIYGIILIVASLIIGILSGDWSGWNSTDGYPNNDEMIAIAMTFVIGIGIATFIWGLWNWRAEKYGIYQQELKIAHVHPLNFCSNCGYRLDRGFNLCPQCGLRLK